MSSDRGVRIVLVTGAGRSGTSAVAGTLKRLGLHVPQPEISPTDTNPRGFYESQWVVDFHEQLLDSIPVRTMDARPEAAALVAAAIEKLKLEPVLREWLSEQLHEQQIVIKDPRIFWVHEMWRKAAAQLGVELSFLTMIRHPAEVISSRERAFLTERTPAFRSKRSIVNLAGWCNAAVETERATRSEARAYARYADLMSDWRAVMDRIGQQLGLTFNTDLTEGRHHEVDDFIDVGLYRSRTDWDTLNVPAVLQGTAERAWAAMNILVESPYDPDAARQLEGVRTEYAKLCADAEAISLDYTNAEVAIARRKLRTRLDRERRTKLNAIRLQLKKARRQRNRLRARLEAIEAATPRTEKASLSARVIDRMRSFKK